MRGRPRSAVWLALLLPAALGTVFLLFIMPFESVGRPLVAARGALSCGEVLLTQTFTGTSDPYFVLFYFRASGSSDWAEFYVDDESPYWRGQVHPSPDQDSCTVTFYAKKALSYRCGDSRLKRSNGTDVPARAIVRDPLTRDFRASIDPKVSRTEVANYWHKH